MNQHKRVELGILHPLLLVTIIPVITTNGFGYDSASSCDPNASRKGRSSQLLQAIPCDLSVQAYCNLPGSAYPWHAVRRFVHENQGLMRRMYGDVRHISILKEEIDNNDIDIDDIRRTAERYSRVDAGKKMKHVHTTHYEHGRDKSNDVISEPYFRPLQKTTTPKPGSKHKNITSPSSANNTTVISTAKPTFLNITLQNSATKITEDSTPRNNTNNFLNNADGNMIDVKKLSAIANLETNDILLGSVINRNTSNEDSKRPIMINATNTNNTDNNKDNITQTEIIKNIPTISTTNATTVEVTTSVSSESTISSSPVEKNTANNQTERLDALKITKTASKKPEGQLFQDTAHKEQPIVGMKGVNACPVKEEVVAPFWANNTRGEVLALLNLYPFEQYVHWEKCAYEFKQMYCREGCRCEQQYRLHRLLAYDPHNECRGIFSDWFRFPSCCICKCYDIPYDFRVTSRSPRTVVKESIQFVEDELQNAIYDHAVDEWYRPKNVGVP